jgi:AraC-like DNA-binding protein
MEKSIVEKEKRTHGSSAFPLALYDNYALFPEFSKKEIYLHWHEETELLHVHRGSARVKIDEQEAVLGQGEAAYVPSGAIHTARAADGSGFCFEAIVFSLDLLTSGIYDITQTHYINPLKLGRLQLPLFLRLKWEWEKRVVEEMLFLIAAERRKAPGYELAIKGALFKILSELIAQATRAPGDPHQRRQDLDRLKRVIQYIQANYTQRLSLEDMAGLSNLSKFYFCRFFKACIGKSPIDYLHYFRLLQAEKLLRETDMKIIDIAFAVGFHDLSHFNRLFHRQAGIAPSRFRSFEKALA